ncbi:hypothetical protein FS763_01485 [Agrobacterium vitis]|uniref:hypothetical protein n=1 Tax=Allorhizobium ampelinum TaxID=3025782 RepID=UPI001F3F243E|nr:hypothetical protein [Allorhizobium ampelinum]MCF1470602.1 hypothetical protein [Allorhizobium ampelinum]
MSEVVAMRLILIALFSNGLLAVSSTYAGFLDKAVNVITDPLKLDASTQNVIEAVERARLLSAEWQRYLDKSGANLDHSIREYLTSVDGIVGRTFAEARATIDDAANKLNKLEHNVFTDADRFVRCSSAVTSQEIQELLAHSLNTVGASRPRFKLLFWDVGSVEFTPQDIDNPIEAYDKLKTSAFAKINSFTATTEAKYVQFVYGDMERVAVRTECFYAADSALAARLERDILDYRRLGQPWDGAVQ